MTKPTDLEGGAHHVPARDRPRRPRQPWEEEIYQRAIEGPSFWDSLTPEAQEMMDAFDWPSALVGPPPPPPMKRRPRRRGEPPREG